MERVRRKVGEAEQIIIRARAEINQEREKAVDEIKQQVVKISLKAAEQIIGKTLVERDHRDYIEQAISDIDARIS